MQPVDVLRDDRDNFPRPFERDDCVVQGVRPRALINVPALQLVVPVVDAPAPTPKLQRTHRAAPSPDTPRPPEVRDAARGGDPGAAEHQDALRSAQPLDEAWVGHALNLSSSPVCYE